MAKIKGINDDFAWAGLCRGCSRALLIEDERGRQIGYCTASFADPVHITAPVVKCSSFDSKSDVSLHDMHQIAWTLQSDGGRVMGFKPPEPKKKEEED